MLRQIVSYAGEHALHVGVAALSRRDLEVQLFNSESAQIGLDDLALEIVLVLNLEGVLGRLLLDLAGRLYLVVL